MSLLFLQVVDPNAHTLEWRRTAINPEHVLMCHPGGSALQQVSTYVYMGHGLSTLRVAGRFSQVVEAINVARTAEHVTEYDGLRA